MACSPAASECPPSEAGAGAPSIVTDYSQLDSVSVAGHMPMPVPMGGLPEYGLLPQGIFANQFGGAPLQQVARPDGLLQAPLQARGAADPNALPQLLLMQNQQHLQQCMQLMQHQALLLGQGQQTQTASAPAAPRKRSRNNAKRPQKAERERQKQAWIVAQSTAELEENRRSQEVQGDAPAPQCRSDAESWIEVDTAAKVYVDEQISALKLEREALVAELANVRSSMEASIIDAVEGAVRKVMDTIEKGKAEVQAQMKTMVTRDEMAEMPEVEPEGALQKVTEEMEEHRKQLEHLSKVVSALREDMAERFSEKDAAVAQLASEQSVLRASVDKLPLKMGVVQKSLDDERQARTKSMEAMTEKMATKMEEINEQLGQLQRDATANMEAMVEKMVAKHEVQEMATKEWFNEQLGQLQRDATAYMEAMAEKIATKTEVQEERMASKEWVNEQVGQFQRDATARMDFTVKDVDAELSALKGMCKEGQTRSKALQTMVEKKMTIVDEQLGQVREQNRKATAAQDAAVAQLRSEHGQTSGQIRKLSTAGKDVDAKLTAVEARVKTAQTTVLKMTTIDGQPVDVRDVRSKLQLCQVKNPDAIDVFVYSSWTDSSSRSRNFRDIQLVFFDGSLVGQPVKKAYNRIWASSNGRYEVENCAGLRRLVLEHLARNGLEGARWAGVARTAVWWLVKDSSCLKEAFPMDSASWKSDSESLDFFQEFLRRSCTRITEADFDRADNSILSNGN